MLAFFDLGNVLDELERPDESIAAYQRAVELAPRYADAHYNLALAFERKGERRAALRHWQAYARLDKQGPWAEHARGQMRKLLDTEKLDDCVAGGQVHCPAQEYGGSATGSAAGLSYPKSRFLRIRNPMGKAFECQRGASLAVAEEALRAYSPHNFVAGFESNQRSRTLPARCGELLFFQFASGRQNSPPCKTLTPGGLTLA